MLSTNGSFLAGVRHYGRIGLNVGGATVTEPNQSSVQVTQLLRNWRAGDPAALEALLPHVYQELHTVAAAYIRREASGRLSTRCKRNR